MGYFLSIDNFRFLNVYAVFKGIFKDLDDFKNNLDLIKDDVNNNPYADMKKDYLELLLPFLTYPDHGWDFFDVKKKSGVFIFGEYQIEWEIENIEINQNFNRQLNLDSKYKILKGLNHINPKDLNIFKLIKVAIDIVEKNKLNWIEN